MRIKTILIAPRIVYSSLRLLFNPNRLQDVIRLNECLFSSRDLDVLKKHCLKNMPEMFEQRFGFNVIDIDRLSGLSIGSLGRTYHDFMMDNGLSPKVFPNKSSESDDTFLFKHFYETHDIWHVVTGFDTSLEGELALQAFYIAQAPTPLPYLLIGLGFLRKFFMNSDTQSRHLISAVIHGFRLGKEARPLYGANWKSLLELDLREVRHKFNLNSGKDILEINEFDSAA